VIVPQYFHRYIKEPSNPEALYNFPSLLISGGMLYGKLTLEGPFVDSNIPFALPELQMNRKRLMPGDSLFIDSVSILKDMDIKAISTGDYWFTSSVIMPLGRDSTEQCECSAIRSDTLRLMVRFVVE
jgi:hypothetical protein